MSLPCTQDDSLSHFSSPTLSFIDNNPQNLCRYYTINPHCYVDPLPKSEQCNLRLQLSVACNIRNPTPYSTNHHPSATPPKPDFTNPTTDKIRTAHGHATGFLRICHGLLTDDQRAPEGRATDRSRTAHGRLTEIVHERDACRAGGCVFVSCSFIVRSRPVWRSSCVGSCGERKRRAASWSPSAFLS